MSVHSGQPPPYALIAVATAALALLALWRFLVRLKRDRLVADTPEVRIRSAAQGYVKVRGRTQPAGPAPTAAPLSARPCVWWSYEIAHEERDSKGNRRWSTTDSASSVEPFALVDESDARCLVGPVKAEITPTVRNVWYGATSWPMTGPPESSSLLQQLGSWRYTERLLGVGARVCVMGEFRSHSEVGDVNGAIAAKLHEWKQDQQALLARFDLDHDGKLNDAEWET
ncbi:MAG TPA: GIDE domain-containing protein, partial [Steroidobacteraceae bacterium]